VVRSEASRSAILYIEGDPTQVRLVQLMFEERPTLQLLTATDGRAGVALARLLDSQLWRGRCPADTLVAPQIQVCR
jgi:hypothetical protein